MFIAHGLFRILRTEKRRQLRLPMDRSGRTPPLDLVRARAAFYAARGFALRGTRRSLESAACALEVPAS
jgi:hypothetical protein